MTGPKELKQNAIELLKKLIETPSISREENVTANHIEKFLQDAGVKTHRKGNNVWAFNKVYIEGQTTLLLNSHHDTVKPNPSYTNDPFKAIVEEDKLYGLGSNDAGGCLVSLLATFLHFYERPDLPFNLIIAATAEEEISGANGIASILDELGRIDVAIVGEPTQMRMAIAEKGLMVLDCTVRGKAGHAAREEGINSIYKALSDIKWFQNYKFEQVSELLGPVKMSVTQVNSGTQHNVVPDTCKFVVDVRTNEFYSNEDAYKIISEEVSCMVKARSFRLNSSRIDLNHPLVRAGQSMGLEHFGSPTLSDQALIPFPSMKIGPGMSARSHTADEFVLLSEIEAGIETYIKLITRLEGYYEPDSDETWEDQNEDSLKLSADIGMSL
ncbi:MAG: M20 family metallo-hydrolase [Bacteroidota bacterium]